MDVEAVRPPLPPPSPRPMPEVGGVSKPPLVASPVVVEDDEVERSREAARSKQIESAKLIHAVPSHCLGAFSAARVSLSTVRPSSCVTTPSRTKSVERPLTTCRQQGQLRPVRRVMIVPARQHPGTWMIQVHFARRRPRRCDNKVPSLSNAIETHEEKDGVIKRGHLRSSSNTQRGRQLVEQDRLIAEHAQPVVARKSQRRGAGHDQVPRSRAIIGREYEFTSRFPACQEASPKHLRNS